MTKAVPAIIKKKERDASAKLGADLFLIYVQFNEALVLAERIVRSLEGYAERMTDHMRTGGDKYALTAGSWVSDDIHQQLRNLVGIRNQIDRRKWELQVLDGQSTNEIQFLLDLKSSALDALARTIENQRMPLRTTGIMIDDRGVLHALDDGSAYDPYRNDVRYFKLSEELAMNSVPMDEPWGPEILAIVKDYLASRKPWEHLDEIRTSLEKIRAALEANFTISDILLRAGDPRVDRTRPY
ncbi:MAG: hypothetical protein ACRDRO_17755 [Pseudonocardiaceae bacterium]